MSTLYIVATPIGNLADMTYRAVETLKNVDLIIAEDTRQTSKLLQHYEVPKKTLLSFHAQSSHQKALEICNQIEQAGSGAFVSDAGTPCISDPGFVLIREAIARGITLVPIPGASALTTLASVAGVPVDSFVWHGFLPHKKGRQTIIKSFIDADVSHVFYESVHRFPKLIKELSEHIGSDRIIVVGRELTKMHEEVFRGTIQEAAEHFDETNTKGEFVVIVPSSKYSLSSQ